MSLARFRDHRGRRCRAFETDARGVRAAGLTPHEIDHLRRTAGDAGEWMLSAPVLGICLAFVTLLIVGNQVAGRGGFTPGSVVLSGIALGLVALLLVRPSTGSRREASLALLELRRCASCGYPLDALAMEADRCVVCSECGAAWILPESVFWAEAGPR